MLIPIVLVLLGLVCIAGGVRFHLGYFRAPIVYWTTFSSGVYATAPLGVGLILFGLGSQIPSPDLRGIFLIFAISFGVIGIILGITTPQFLTPWWFRYLREEYEEWYILHILMRDAAKDYSGWKERTKTMEGLVSWADEVRRKTRIEET